MFGEGRTKAPLHGKGFGGSRNFTWRLSLKGSLYPKGALKDSFQDPFQDRFKAILWV